MEKYLTLRQDGFDSERIYESSQCQGEEGWRFLGPSQQPIHRSATHRLCHRCLHHAQHVGPDQVLGPSSFHGEPCQIHQQLLLGKEHLVFFVVFFWRNRLFNCTYQVISMYSNHCQAKTFEVKDFWFSFLHWGYISLSNPLWMNLFCVLNIYNFECNCYTGKEHILPTLSRGNSPTRRRKRPHSLLSMDSLHPSGTGEYFVLWSWPWIDPDLVSDLEIYVWRWHISSIWLTNDRRY